MDGLVYGWVGGWMDECTLGWVEHMGGEMHEQVYGWMDGCMFDGAMGTCLMDEHKAQTYDCLVEMHQ